MLKKIYTSQYKLLILFLIIIFIMNSCPIRIEESDGHTNTDSNTSLSNIQHFGGDFLWYGIDPDRTNQESLDAFSDTLYNIGMESVRFDIYWGMIERSEKGNYNWDLTDQLLNSISNDTPVIFTLYSTSKWGSKYNEFREQFPALLGLTESYNMPPSSIPINMQDYMDFLETIVNKYKNRVKYWQIENEVYGARIHEELPAGIPPFNNFWIGTKEEYAELVKQSYIKIKEVDPDSCVFMSSIAFGEIWPNPNLPADFLKFILRISINYTDFIDLHLYGSVYTVSDRINYIKNEISLLGYYKPLICTESGEIDIRLNEYKTLYSNSFNNPGELKTQAEEIIKRHAFAFAGGIEKIYRLRLNPFKITEDPSSNWPHMSLTLDKNAINKKPGYYTYKLMTSKIKNFITVNNLEEGVFRFNFSTKRSVFILWSDTGNRSINISNYLQSKNIKITSIITELNTTKPDEIITDNKIIQINKTPIFIEEAE